MLSLYEALAAAGGALLLCAGLLWRARSRRQAMRLLRSALASPDPSYRRAAVSVAGEDGLARHATVLMKLAWNEPDPFVRDELAAVVVRNQWEPAERPELVTLRLWARQHLEVRRAAAEVIGQAQRRQPRRSPDETRKLNVLVTGAGGPAGVAVLQAARAAGHRVIAADTDPDAVGLVLADDGGTLPPGSDPGLVQAVCTLALRTGADTVVSTVAEELIALAMGEAQLQASGISSWLPDPEAVRVCNDKWAFAQALLDTGVPVPATGLGSAKDVPGPWIVKPRQGRGSRDVYAVDTVAGLKRVLRAVPDAIVQTRLSGQEFTVDALVDRDGALVGMVPRWRLETRGGISTRARTFSLDGLPGLVAELLRLVALTGPATVQGFVSPDGQLAFTEVNPRFSGGLPMSIAAGADLVGEYLRGAIGQAMRPERLAYRDGVTIARYFSEVVT